MKKHISKKRKSNDELDGQPPNKRRKLGIEEKFSLEVVRKQKQMLGLQVKEKSRELKRLNEENKSLKSENRNLGEVITLFHNHHEQLDTDLKTLFPNVEDKYQVHPPPPTEKEGEDLLNSLLSSYSPEEKIFKKKRMIESPSSSHTSQVSVNDAVRNEVASTKRIIKTFYNELDKKRQEQEDFFRQYFQEQKPDLVLQEIRKQHQTSENELKLLHEKHQHLNNKYRELKNQHTSKTVKIRQMKKEIELVKLQFNSHDLKMRKSSKQVEVLNEKIEELEKHNSQLVVKLKQQSLPVISSSQNTPTTPNTPSIVNSPKKENESLTSSMITQPQQHQLQPSMNMHETTIPQEQQQRRINSIVGQENQKLRQLVSDLRIEVDEVKILLSKRTEQLERKDERIQSLQNSFIESGGGGGVGVGGSSSDNRHQHLGGSIDEQKKMILTSHLYTSKSKQLQEFMEKNDQLYNELDLRENEIERLRGELSSDKDRLEGVYERRWSEEYGTTLKKSDQRIGNLEQDVSRLRLKLSSSKYQEQLRGEVRQAQARLESRGKKLTKLQEELELRGVDKKELINRLHFSQKSYKIQKKKLDEALKQTEDLKIILKRVNEGKNINDDGNSKVELISINHKQKEKIKELKELISKLGGDEGKEKIERLEKELSYEKEMTEQFEKEMEELSRHCQNLEKYKDKLNLQIEQFQVEKRKFVLENVKASNRNEIYVKEINLLKKEKDQFLQLLESKEKERKTLKDLLNGKDKLINISRQETEIERKSKEKIRKDIQNINSKLIEAKQSLFNAEIEVRNQKKIAKSSVSESTESQRKANHYEEECEKLAKRLERIENSEENAELIQRIEYWKKYALCPICEVRVKSKVITKCSHAFCSECLEKSVGARNRKCPQCNDPFSPKSHITKLFL